MVVLYVAVTYIYIYIWEGGGEEGKKVNNNNNNNNNNKKKKKKKKGSGEMFGLYRWWCFMTKILFKIIDKNNYLNSNSDIHREIVPIFQKQ